MAHVQISTFHTWQKANLRAHFVRAIIQHQVDLSKESWASVKIGIIKYCQRFLKKIVISGSIGPNKSLKTGKFSLAHASVKWKFVTDVLDIFGLFLSSSRFCFHACRLQFVYHATNYALNKLELASCFRAALWHS